MNSTVTSTHANAKLTTTMPVVASTNVKTTQMAAQVSNDMKYVWVNWFHFLVVGPLLVYIGYKGKSTPQWAFWALVVLAVVVILYHLWILSQKMSQDGMNTKREGFSSRCPADAFSCA